MSNRAIVSAFAGIMGLIAAAGAAPPSMTPSQSADRDEIRAVVSAMLADAETRSSLLAGGATAGHDGQFFLGSADGQFRLNLGGLVQFRYMMDFTSSDNTAVAGDDGFESGFQTQRTRLWFDGTIYGDWIYRVQANFSESDGTGTLEDAYFGHALNENWVVAAGQVKAPHLREDMVDDQFQLAAEKSPTGEFFAPGRVQALWVNYNSENLRGWATFNDGAGAANTDFTNPAEADYGLSCRGEYKFAGNWSQFADFTSPKGSEFACMLGGLVHWQQGTNTSNPGDTDTDVLLYSLDLSLEGDGWNAFGAFYGRHIELRAAGPDTELDDYGLVFQGGYRFTDQTEGFARYDVIFVDNDWGSDEDSFGFLTFGVNQYIHGNAAKFTADMLVALDKTADGVAIGSLPSTTQGLRGDSDSGEVVVRLQFSLQF